MFPISQKIISWYSENKRELPWRNTKEPYLIWLSEIILQQTRVEQGLPYYLRFIEKFPDIFSLARADESEVLRYWQGLGYYSRARNLHYTAKSIVNEFNGKFPETFQGLLKLKGVGNYTAAAIASFCFLEKIAVVDGNVFRFLSRIYDIDIPINSSEGTKLFDKIANQLIPEKTPDIYNQSIMEFGATCCTPQKPNCDKCPFILECLAYKNNTVEIRPIKLKSKKRREVYYIYFYPLNSDEIILQKINRKTIYQNMYEFPKLEFEVKEDFIQLLKKLKNVSEIIVHDLSHIRIHAVFADSMKVIHKENAIKIPRNEINNYPLPRLITKYLEISDYRKSNT